jgi:hypothetical protein
MSGLRLFACRACGHVWQFRRALCPACAAHDPDVREASGEGTIWSFTVVHRAPTPEEDVPGGYGIALVSLREGARVMARSTRTDLATGDAVRVEAVGSRLLVSPVSTDPPAG